MSKNKSIIYRYSDNEFKEIFHSSHSYSEVLRKMGLCTVGSASRTVLFQRMNELSLTREDLSQKRLIREATNKLSDDDIFKFGSRISGHTLKSHYINQRKGEYKCDCCGISLWQGKPLVLHLDHINGIKLDNRIGNLRLLCPNCDSQMETYRGKNIKIASKPRKTLCPLCGKGKTADATYCKKCSNRINSLRKRRFIINRDELKILIRTTSFIKIGEQYGVSDNAIRKRCKYYNLPYKTSEIKKYSDIEWKQL